MGASVVSPVSDFLVYFVRVECSAGASGASRKDFWASSKDFWASSKDVVFFLPSGPFLPQLSVAHNGRVSSPSLPPSLTLAFPKPVLFLLVVMLVVVMAISCSYETAISTPMRIYRYIQANFFFLLVLSEI